MNASAASALSYVQLRFARRAYSGSLAGMSKERTRLSVPDDAWAANAIGSGAGAPCATAPSAIRGAAAPPGVRFGLRFLPDGFCLTGPIWLASQSARLSGDGVAAAAPAGSAAATKRDRMRAAMRRM